MKTGGGYEMTAAQCDYREFYAVMSGFCTFTLVYIPLD